MQFLAQAVLISITGGVSGILAGIRAFLAIFLPVSIRRGALPGTTARRAHGSKGTRAAFALVKPNYSGIYLSFGRASIIHPRSYARPALAAALIFFGLGTGELRARNESEGLKLACAGAQGADRARADRPSRLAGNDNGFRCCAASQPRRAYNRNQSDVQHYMRRQGSLCHRPHLES